MNGSFETKRPVQLDNKHPPVNQAGYQCGSVEMLCRLNRNSFLHLEHGKIYIAYPLVNRQQPHLEDMDPTQLVFIFFLTYAFFQMSCSCCKWTMISSYVFVFFQYFSRNLNFNSASMVFLKHEHTQRHKSNCEFSQHLLREVTYNVILSST